MHVLILGPICPQPMKIWEETPLPLKVPTEVSEECLYLNVWTPTLDTEARLPVMLWIHGGGFVAGTLKVLFFGSHFNPHTLLRGQNVFI